MTETNEQMKEDLLAEIATLGQQVRELQQLQHILLERVAQEQDRLVRLQLTANRLIKATSRLTEMIDNSIRDEINR